MLLLIYADKKKVSFTGIAQYAKPEDVTAAIALHWSPVGAGFEYEEWVSMRRKLGYNAKVDWCRNI